MNNMFRRIINLLIILLCNLDLLKYSVAIKGDTNNIRTVNPNEYPPVVCIVQYVPHLPYHSTTLCSGVLITRSHVLTAAHCLTISQAVPVEVLVGPGELARSSSYYPIWWISYNQWELSRDTIHSTGFNDIAILKIFGLPLEFPAASITDIFLATTDLYGLTVQTYGCGNLMPSSSTIQTANLTVIRHTECESIIQHIAKAFLAVPSHFICTRNSPYVQTEHGDSGGPVVHSGQVVAINIGVAPKLNHQFSPEKVNLHNFVGRYRHFFSEICSI